MTASTNESPREDEPPKDATMLVLMALIRALHEQGTLPAQAVANVLDRRAVNAALRGSTSNETIVRETAVAVQKFADLVERQTPFGTASRHPTAE
ncbi:hypothetical protein [Paraburkholderia aromaticivorans]|uniref:hypothetical protein n=1 Tax=Paraburkholderia aromaticivorans TaxID=2026199 RepID=UPI001455FED3|nr:hypothetical protein [Paraburkholderia aromaticivorans]